MQFEFLNPLAAPAMLVIRLFLMVFDYWEHGLAPAAVGIALVVFYGKYLSRTGGNAY
jgi:hypothetical protein